MPAHTGTFKANLIAWLGDAANGIDKIFTKELIAENVTATTGNFATMNASSTISDAGTFGKLCVGTICVTPDQFKAMVAASALAGQAAAGAATAPTGAPAATPAPNREESTNTATTTAPATSVASSTPSAANDASTNSAPATASTTPQTPTDTLLVDAPEEPPSSEPELEAANDNPLPPAPTATDG